MFANLLEHLVRRAESADYDLAFVREVRVHARSPRNRRVELTMGVAWVLIALKCWLVTWLVAKYQMPFHAMWVNAPTVVFALLGTAVYVWRD